MPAEIVVLGGGVGGTLAANLLQKELRNDAHITVVDPTAQDDDLGRHRRLTWPS